MTHFDGSFVPTASVHLFRFIYAPYPTDSDGSDSPSLSSPYVIRIAPLSHPLWDDVGSISPASIPLVATDLISAPLSDSQMTDSDSHHLHGVYAVGIGSA